MRYGNDSPMFMLNGDRFFCVHLPADYCAEHEWGVKELKEFMGIPKLDVTEPPFDINRFKSTIVPPIHFKKTKSNTKAALVVGREADDLEHYQTDFLKGWVTPFKHRDEPKDFKIMDVASNSKWCCHSFAVYTEDKLAIKCLEELHQAFQDTNVEIHLGGHGPFLNGGLNIAIVDRIPEEQLKAVADDLAETAKLHTEARATGVYEKIDRSRYFALSPRWKGWDRDKDTKHPVMFWLNPCEQHKNNSGWFTVEELEQWVEGTGPVIKTK